MKMRIGAVAVAAATLAGAVLTGTAPASHAAPRPAAAPVVPVIVRCGAGGLEIRGGALPGGYQCAPLPYGHDVWAAARALVASVDRDLPEATPRLGRYVVLSAADQVVAGVNYQLVVAVSGWQPEILVGTVHRALNGTFTVMNQYTIAHGTTHAHHPAA